MTQAFNLSQLANFVDSSGKISLTTAVTGILPVANGGTGTSTPAIVAGTGITVSGSFPNQTVTCTVTGGVTSLNGQTGAITDTTLYAIGSYIIAGSSSNDSARTINSTYSASQIRNCGTATAATHLGGRTFAIIAGVASNYNYASESTPSAGTWRCMSPVDQSSNDEGYAMSFTGLFVRIS